MTNLAKSRDSHVSVIICPLGEYLRSNTHIFRRGYQGYKWFSLWQMKIQRDLPWKLLFNRFHNRILFYTTSSPSGLISTLIEYLRRHFQAPKATLTCMSDRRTLSHKLINAFTRFGTLTLRLALSSVETRPSDAEIHSIQLQIPIADQFPTISPLLRMAPQRPLRHCPVILDFNNQELQQQYPS